MRAMGLLGDEPVPTAQVADELGRKPSSASPARDSLIKKGLIYSSERGLIAFTVPHFGRFLRAQPARCPARLPEGPRLPEVLPAGGPPAWPGPAQARHSSERGG